METSVLLIQHVNGVKERDITGCDWGGWACQTNKPWKMPPVSAALPSLRRIVHLEYP